MRKLVMILSDAGLAIVERVPGPYSHSDHSDVVLFTATADEMDASEREDTRTKGKKDGKGKQSPPNQPNQQPVTDPAEIEQALTDTTPATDLTPAAPAQAAPESKKK